MTYQSGGKPITGNLRGDETVVVGNGGPQITTATTQQIAALAALESTSTVITALNTVGAGVITAAGIIGKITSRGGAQSATAFSDTTATAAAIIAALPVGAPVGTTFLWRYKNTTDGAATLLAGVGVTLSGAVVIPKGTWYEYLVTVTSAAAVTIASVEGGSLSPLPPAQFTTLTSVQIGGVSTIQVGSLTGAQVVSVSLTGTVAPFTLYTPSAAELLAGQPNALIGSTFILNIQNLRTTTGIGTLAGGTGVTIAGTATIAQNVCRSFSVSIDSATTATVTSLGAMSL